MTYITIYIYACSFDIDTSLSGRRVGNNCREKLAENLADTCTSSIPASKTRENYKLQTISRKLFMLYAQTAAVCREFHQGRRESILGRYVILY